MLVLTRKIGEAIIIGDARIMVGGITGGRVKIGIEAPDHVQIVREEIEKEKPECYCVQEMSDDGSWPPPKGPWLQSRVATLAILRRFQWLRPPGAKYRVVNQDGEAIE